MSEYQIKNQKNREGGFMRSLVLNGETNQPRPVWRADRTNGKSKQAGTYQCAKPDDIVIVVEVDTLTKESRLMFRIIDDNGVEVSVEDGFNFKPAMGAINTLVDEWLYSMRSEPYLPKGVGWDGVTPQVEKIKVDKAMALLPENMPSKLLKELLTSISYTSINVFNKVTTTMDSKSEVITLPPCDLCIEINADNKYVTQQALSESRTENYSPVIAIDEHTVKLAIICFNSINNTSVKQMSLSIIELI